MVEASVKPFSSTRIAQPPRFIPQDTIHKLPGAETFAGLKTAKLTEIKATKEADPAVWGQICSDLFLGGLDMDPWQIEWTR